MKQWQQRLGVLIMAGLLALLVVPGLTSAASLDSESIALSNPTISATGVTYTIIVSNQSAVTIECVKVRFTDTLGSAGLPTGMDISAVTLGGTSTVVPTPGLWTTTGVNATGEVSITKLLGETPAGGGSRSIVLSGIKNGSVNNTTYYAEISTYSNSSCTTLVDTDGVALYVFTTGVLITSTVADTLNFSIDPSCSMGQLTPATTGNCSLDMHASTNHATGYTISYTAPSTMHESLNADSITAIGATAATSTTGIKQFGFNLVANTTPPTGFNPSGGGGTALGQYAIANKFAFITSGANIASAAALSADTLYRISFIANTAPNMVSGNYVAQQTYTIVANP